LDGERILSGERACDMSKYIRTYEALCPQDRIHRSDPRRAAIIAEMRAIRAAKTLSQAAKVVEWWDVWPNEQHATAEEFCREAKSLMANCP
jgi:hypothetical protein